MLIIIKLDGRQGGAQDDPTFNAGTGSNLTEGGHVECDASIMVAGSAAIFSAVGAVSGVILPASWQSRISLIELLVHSNKP